MCFKTFYSIKVTYQERRDVNLGGTRIHPALNRRNRFAEQSRQISQQFCFEMLYGVSILRSPPLQYPSAPLQHTQIVTIVVDFIKRNEVK